MAQQRPHWVIAICGIRRLQIQYQSINPVSLSSLKPGAFVEIASEANQLGTGKLIRLSQSTAFVQYFDAPGAAAPNLVECQLAELRAVRIPTQSRVYRRHSGARWQVGRVLEDEGTSLFVQFPNGETQDIDVADLFVRWNRPLSDPLPLLCVEATETPFLAEARSSFVRQVARQRTAAAGIPAVLSASIELEDYQFEVVRRVLCDPIQRYLLADEVGLGKTIEASVIIRQHFLDGQDARAVVIVPAPLVQQWRWELSHRFGLQEKMDEFLHVVSHDDIEQLRNVIGTAGLLVVDEAHHLSRQTTEAEARLYALLLEHCSRVHKLLLLSATPVLADEQGFLRVLHLLDPVVFPLDDLEGFQRRVASRQLVAEVVATLIPENLWGLQAELDRLEGPYGDDPVLAEKIKALRGVLNSFPAEDDENFLASLQDLRTHLLESYRLHRRMLRNRRSAVSWATVGRSGVHTANIHTTGAAHYRESWEPLRHALNEAQVLSDSLAAILTSAALHGRSRVCIKEALLANGLDEPQLIALATAVDVSGAQWRASEERFALLSREVRRLLSADDLQAVVFCDRPEDADRATATLQAEFGPAVQRYEPRTASKEDAAESEWAAFQSSSRQIRVLVCDFRVEEGVNLHGGRKCAIHFDLPAAPNRIEQRLGRLDRYGKGHAVHSVVLVDDGNPDERLWAEVLTQGWQVFNRSVASLQYLIESTSRSLAQDWLHHGTIALQNALEALEGRDGLVQREIRDIDHQDALDALAQPDPTHIDDLQDCDEDWRIWRAAFKGFAIGALQFVEQPASTRPASPDTDYVVRIGYAHRGSDSQTLLPMTSFLRDFLQSVDLNARRGSSLPLSHKYAFARKSVTSRSGLADRVHLLRIGDPLVSALERFCESDDRGRAFALWRVDRQYEVQDSSEADLFFRFDFVIRAPHELAGPEAGGDPSLQQALARKAVSFFPPVFVRVWVDGAGRVLEEPSQILNAPYQDTWQGTRRDFNLNPNRWRALPPAVRSSWMRGWSDLCHQRRAEAQAFVLQSAACLHQVTKALQACERESRLAVAQVESRLVRLSGAAREQHLAELDREKALYASLSDALRRPSVQLDVVGAFFVGSDTPFD